MILDLKKLKAKGKNESEFFFEYAPESLPLSIPFTELAFPVTVSGTVTLCGEHSAYVDGEVCFTLKGQCNRCLADAERSYVTEFAEKVDEDNENGYAPVNDVIDLSKIVNDTILTALPVSFLCSDGCLGLCPVCGGNLNKGEC